MPPVTLLNSTATQALALLPKICDSDSDIRYMSLSDLNNLLIAGNSNLLSSDYHASAKLIDSVIQALDDQNGEVQNQAIKW